MERSVSVANTVMIHLSMVYVLMADVAVTTNVLETNSRYVVVTGLSPSTQSVSRLAVYWACELKPRAALRWVYPLMQIGKIPHFG